MNREKVIDTMGDLMFQAARASITQGAMYDPGESIQNDAKSAWRGIAGALVKMVEEMIKEKQAIEAERPDDKP